MSTSAYAELRPRFMFHFKTNVDFITQMNFVVVAFVQNIESNRRRHDKLLLALCARLCKENSTPQWQQQQPAVTKTQQFVQKAQIAT